MQAFEQKKLEKVKAANRLVPEIVALITFFEVSLVRNGFVYSESFIQTHDLLIVDLSCYPKVGPITWPINATAVHGVVVA